MEQNTCNCAFKTSMTQHILDFQREHPDSPMKWVEQLYGKDIHADASPLCCMLTFLFYYGYCQECTTPVSEFAAQALEPLMETTKLY